MYWPIDDFAVRSILLDQKNIRLPYSERTQKALIQDLFSNEDAFDLVKSIVQYDIFPDEYPVIIKMNGNDIVIEGNRRIAALKALLEPEIVPSFVSKLKSFKNPNIEIIKAVIAPDRDSATKLIANKHTINLRRPWKPLRQAYFYKSQMDNGKSIEEIKKEYPDHDIPKFIKMLEMHRLAKSIDYEFEKVTKRVHDERKFPITNLERMYNDPIIKKYLGISFTSTGQVKGQIDKSEFEKGYKRIVEDVANGEIDSRRYNSATQRKKYINELPDSCKPNLKLTGEFSASDFKEKKVDLDGSDKRERSTKKYRGLIPSYVPFKLHSSALKEVYNELRGISVEDFPNATHDLLRSFLECTLVYYLKQTGEYDTIRKNEKHVPKISELLKFISSEECKSISDLNIKQIVEHVKSQYSKDYSLVRMHMINHNENWISEEKEVRSAWNKIEGLMKILLNPKNDDK